MPLDCVRRLASDVLRHAGRGILVMVRTAFQTRIHRWRTAAIKHSNELAAIQLTLTMVRLARQRYMRLAPVVADEADSPKNDAHDVFRRMYSARPI